MRRFIMRNEKLVKKYIASKATLKKIICDFLSEEAGEAGVNYLLMIAISIIIGALILIPGFRRLSTSMMAGIEGFWADMKTVIFQKA